MSSTTNTINPTEGEAGSSSNNGNNALTTLASPQQGGSFLQSPNTMFPPPYEIQSHFGFLNSIARSSNNQKSNLAAKKLIVQIGSFKMLKAIGDPNSTVQDLIHDILWKDNCLGQLEGLLENKKTKLLPSNHAEAILKLSLGPNRSMELVVTKEAKGQLKFSIPKEGAMTTSKKRKRNEPILLKLQLVTADSGILLCPRDPIYPLIESGEKVLLQPAGEGSWEYPKLPNDGNELVVPPAAAAQAPQEQTEPAPPQEEEPRPAKRQRIQKEPETQQPSPQKVAASPTKKRKSEAPAISATSNQETSQHVASQTINGELKPKAVDKDPKKTTENVNGDKETNGATKKAKTTTADATKSTPKATPKAKENPKAGAKADATKSTPKATPKAKENPKAGAKADATKPTPKATPKAKENPKTKAKPAKTTKPSNKKDNKTGGSEKSSSSNSSEIQELDVLFGRGKGIRLNPGNVKYAEFIQSKAADYDDLEKRRQIIEHVRSTFRFHKKEKGAKTFALVKKSSSIITQKITRDLLKANDEQTKSKTSMPTKESKPEDRCPPENTDDGALSDETPRAEEEAEINEINSDEEPSESLETQQDDGDASDESSNASSSNGDDESVSEKSSSSNSDTSDVPKRKLQSQSQEEEASSVSESVDDNDEENDDEEEEEEEDEKNPADSGDDEEKETNDAVPKSVDVNAQSGDDDSEDESDNESDDSSTSSSSVSSDSSSSVSSSSSDDDSGSDDSSTSSNEDETESPKKLTARDSLAKLTPTRKGSKKEVQPQSTGSKRKRKPLLDPSQKLLFLPTSSN